MLHCELGPRNCNKCKCKDYRIRKESGLIKARQATTPYTIGHFKVSTRSCVNIPQVTKATIPQEQVKPVSNVSKPKQIRNVWIGIQVERESEVEGERAPETVHEQMWFELTPKVSWILPSYNAATGFLSGKIFVVTSYHKSINKWYCQCKHFTTNYLASQHSGSRQFKCLHIDMLQDNFPELNIVVLGSDANQEQFNPEPYSLGETQVHDNTPEVNDEHSDSQLQPPNNPDSVHDVFHDIVRQAHEGLEDFEVEKVVGKRITDSGETEYLIKWRNYGSRSNEWKRLDDMNCDRLVDDFELANGGTIPGTKESPVTRVGNAWLVPYGRRHEEQYCWVVFSREGKLKCRDVHNPTCSLHTHHVRRVEEWCSHQGVVAETFAPPASKQKHSKTSKPLSKKAIPRHIPSHIQQKLREGSFGDCLAPVGPDLSPLCACGGPWRSENEFLCLGTLYTCTGIRSVTVMVRRCNQGTCRADYDGYDDGVFNYSGKTMVAYDVLFSYIADAVASGITFAAFCNTMTRRYKQMYASDTPFLTRATFIKVYFAYSNLVMSPTSDPPCSICGQYPPVLMADATDLGMPLKYILPSCRRAVPPDATLRDVQRTPFRDRVLVPEHEARSHLKNFVTGKRTLRKADWQKMLRLLDKYTRSRTLKVVLEHLLSLQPDNEHLAHFHFAGHWADLFRVLAAHTSITDLIRAPGIAIARKLATQEGYRLTAGEEVTLRKAAPILYNIYEKLRTWPAFAMALLGAITDTCEKPFDGLHDGDNQVQVIDAENPTLSGFLYPYWPRLRRRPRYPMDATPEDTWNEENQCRKKQLSVRRRLTWGVFSFVCQHQACYGLHLLTSPEGRRDLFTVLFEYMPQHVLDGGLVVIYDFGCNLREYMLNREPEMFHHVMVYIDRFHMMNHKCSSLCSLETNLYPTKCKYILNGIEYYRDLQQLRTSLIESWNRFLQLFRSQVAYMRQETCMLFLRDLTNAWNDWVLGHK